MDSFDSFNKFMNKIEADSDLKENTKKTVREALTTRTQQETIKDSRTTLIKSFFARKILVTACSLAILTLLSFSGYAYYVTPVNYISLDINPSVELGINAFNTVVSAEGINSDGKNLLEGKTLTNMSVQESVNALIIEAAKQNYISEDGSTVIAVTSESEHEADAANLLNDCIKGINSALDNMNADAIIYKDSTNLDIRGEAENLNISPGKLKLINYLQTLDPSITVDQYRDSYISEIISDANNLLTDNDTSNTQLSESDATTQEILDAAEQLQQTQGETSEEQELNQKNQADDDSSVDNSDNQENNQTNDSSLNE